MSDHGPKPPNDAERQQHASDHERIPGFRYSRLQTAEETVRFVIWAGGEIQLIRIETGSAIAER